MRRRPQVVPLISTSYTFRAAEAKIKKGKGSSEKSLAEKSQEKPAAADLAAEKRQKDRTKTEKTPEKKNAASPWVDYST